ncbi:MAG: hypothetical protein F7C35_05625 [Desulfurococcales archaeon]|nr:hypothetical protein [Desulfurococcales archaeon]
MSNGSRDPAKDPAVVKKMARLMMQGAVMLAERCPICGLPLFRLKSGDVVCPVHGKIIVVSDEEQADEIRLDYTIRMVEHYAASKVKSLIGEGSPDEILDWLKVIEAVERIKQLRRPQEEKRAETSKKRG